MHKTFTSHAYQVERFVNDVMTMSLVRRCCFLPRPKSHITHVIVHHLKQSSSHSFHLSRDKTV